MGYSKEIFDDLCKENIISQVDVIIGESHHGLAPIIQQLQPSFDLVHYTPTHQAIMCQQFIFENKGSWK